MEENSKNILEELRVIREDLHYIKKHMVDIDMFLTAEEENMLDDSLKEYIEGKTTSLEKFQILDKRERIHRKTRRDAREDG